MSPRQPWRWKVADPSVTEALGLRYEPGNWGDILKAVWACTVLESLLGGLLKGDVGTEFAQVISAAERDASDSINRDRVPRQYQKAVKSYFSNVQRITQDAGGAESASPADSGQSVP